MPRQTLGIPFHNGDVKRKKEYNWLPIQRNLRSRIQIGKLHDPKAWDKARWLYVLPYRMGSSFNSSALGDMTLSLVSIVTLLVSEPLSKSSSLSLCWDTHKFHRYSPGSQSFRSHSSLAGSSTCGTKYILKNIPETSKSKTWICCIWKLAICTWVWVKL